MTNKSQFLYSIATISLSFGLQALGAKRPINLDTYIQNYRYAQEAINQQGKISGDEDRLSSFGPTVASESIEIEFSTEIRSSEKNIELKIREFVESLKLLALEPVRTQQLEHKSSIYHVAIDPSNIQISTIGDSKYIFSYYGKALLFYLIPDSAKQSISKNNSAVTKIRIVLRGRSHLGEFSQEVLSLTGDQIAFSFAEQKGKYDPPVRLSPSQMYTVKSIAEAMTGGYNEILRNSSHIPLEQVKPFIFDIEYQFLTQKNIPVHFFREPFELEKTGFKALVSSLKRFCGTALD